MTTIIKIILLFALLGAEWRLCLLRENIATEIEPLITFLGALATYLGAEFWIARKGESRNQFPKINPTSNPNDIQLFHDLISLFNENVMQFYKEHDFGGSFSKGYLPPLFEFVGAWNSAHREFVDPELEESRRAFFSSAQALSASISKSTTLNKNGFVSVLPDYLPPGPRPKHILEEAKEMNDNASLFHTRYESLVRLCRQKLPQASI